MEPKLSRETARAQLDEFFLYYTDTDCDELVAENSEELVVLEKNIRTLERAIMHGRVEVEMPDGGGPPVVTLHLRDSKVTGAEGNKLVFARVKATARIAMREAKDNDKYGQLLAFTGAVCGVKAAHLAQIEGRDLSVFEAVMLMFQQV